MTVLLCGIIACRGNITERLATNHVDVVDGWNIYILRTVTAIKICIDIENWTTNCWQSDCTGDSTKGEGKFLEERSAAFFLQERKSDPKVLWGIEVSSEFDDTLILNRFAWFFYRIICLFKGLCCVLCQALLYWTNDAWYRGEISNVCYI